MRSKGSVTHWIEQIKAGDEGVAQQELWHRYFERLVALARKKLGGIPRRGADEEDVALSALNSFFQRAPQGNFPQLHDRNDLWLLLAKITVRKAINQFNRERADKRGGGRVRGESVFAGCDSEASRRVLEQFAGEEPTPSVLAQISEECRRLLHVLSDETLRTVAKMKLEGYTNAEVAREFNVTERTVERKLKLIRKQWSDHRQR